MTTQMKAKKDKTIKVDIFNWKSFWNHEYIYENHYVRKRWIVWFIERLVDLDYILTTTKLERKKKKELLKAEKGFRDIGDFVKKADYDKGIHVSEELRNQYIQPTSGLN